MPTFEWICVSTLLIPPIAGIFMGIYDGIKKIRNAKKEQV